MTTNNAEYRAQLVDAVEQFQEEERSRAVAEECSQMTTEQLLETICTGLGLPVGTQFTRKQLARIAGSPETSESDTDIYRPDGRLLMDDPK